MEPILMLMVASETKFEILFWTFGLLLGPGIGWAIYMMSAMGNVKKASDKLVDMHNRPDEFGFGTGAVDKHTQENTRALRTLTYYLKWLAEHTTGETPPPPVGAEYDDVIDRED